jgi:hypothetical protein
MIRDIPFGRDRPIPFITPVMLVGVDQGTRAAGQREFTEAESSSPDITEVSERVRRKVV